MKLNLPQFQALTNNQNNRATFKNLIDLQKQKVPQSRSKSKSRRNVSKSKSVTKRNNRKKQSDVSISIEPSLSRVSSFKNLSHFQQNSDYGDIHNNKNTNRNQNRNNYNTTNQNQRNDKRQSFSSKKNQQQNQNKQLMKQIINMKNKVVIMQQKLTQSQKQLSNVSYTQNSISKDFSNQNQKQKQKQKQKFENRANKLINFLDQYRYQIIKQTKQIGQTYLTKINDQKNDLKLEELQQINFNELGKVKELPKPDLSMCMLEQKLRRLQKQFKV